MKFGQCLTFRKIQQFFLLLLLLTGLCCLPALAEENVSLQAGFGSETPGGQGGKILRVTTLAADGPGSLKKAIDAKGPRIIVFEVGGVINLQRKSLRIREPFVTIAGQTAPSPGITLIQGGLMISTHDVIVQHLCIRPGDAGQPRKSGWECDGITTSGGNAHDVLIDHCSVTWAIDEGISVSGPRTEGPEKTSHRVTIRHCLIAESLHDSTHGKGKHSMGTLVHDHCTDIAILGNLYAHNNQRNPYFKAFTTGVIVNNLIYDPGSKAIQLGFSAGEWKGSGIVPTPPRLSIVGNVFLPGPSTQPKLAMISRPGSVYLRDNQTTAPLKEDVVKELAEKPVWPAGLQPLPAEQVLDFHCQHVGARPRQRDAIDQRIIQNLQTSGGKIIHSQDEVGGYPDRPSTQRKLKIPQENVQNWLQEMAAELE